MTRQPPISDLVPHGAPMLLLDELLESTEESVKCGLTVRGDGLFDQDGRVPAWLGIEYMAQSIAAFSGMEQWRLSKPVKVGFLLGTRRFTTNAPNFRVGHQLIVTAKRVLQGSNGMAAFECRVTGDGIEQTATLSVFEPSNADAQAMLNGVDA